MEEQSFPLIEIAYLYLYLSVPVYLLGIVLLYNVLRWRKVFTWLKFFGASLILVFSIIVISLSISFYVNEYLLLGMWSFIHVGALLALGICGFLYLLVIQDDRSVDYHSTDL